MAPALSEAESRRETADAILSKRSRSLMYFSTRIEIWSSVSATFWPQDFSTHVRNSKVRVTRSVEITRADGVPFSWFRWEALC